MSYHMEDVEELQNFLKTRNKEYDLTDEEAMELLQEVHDMIELGEWTVQGGEL